MIVNGDREGFLGVLLTDAIFVELSLDIGGLGNRDARFGLLGLCRKFLIEDVLAKDDAIFANVNAGTGDQFFYLRV